ncbi:MAG: formylglycine-generating enzyme family protein [Leptospiraceae bacterium]|nr:formylglycine-generating enzyme family protein [Leptospiraceae bacterium]
MKQFLIYIITLTFLQSCLGLHSQKAEKKKKIFISKIAFSKDIPPLVSGSIQSRLVLYLIERFGQSYSVTNEKEIKIMYKKAIKLLNQDCNSIECARPLAEAIDADEIIFGSLNVEGQELILNFKNLSRNRETHAIKTKSNVQKKFAIENYEHYVKEIVGKLMDPQYFVQNPKPNEGEESILPFEKLKEIKELQKIEIPTLENQELFQNIKNFLQEGDDRFQKKSYLDAREKYLNALETLQMEIKKQELSKFQDFIKQTEDRISITYAMDTKLQIEAIDRKIPINTTKDLSINSLEGFLQEYQNINGSLPLISSKYNSRLSEIQKEVQNRMDTLSIVLAEKYKVVGENAYRQFKFEEEAIPSFEKSLSLLQKIYDKSRSAAKTKEVEDLLAVAQRTCSNYVHNNVHSLLKITEYLNLQNQDVTSEMQNAKATILKSKYADAELVYSYNILARLTKQEIIQKDGEKKEEKKSYNPTTKNSIDMEFVLVPAGDFEMGDIPGDGDFDEKPAHIVRISNPFYLAKYPVTQEQWDIVMKENPSGFNDSKKQPVENVSWEDAYKFIRKLNEMEETNAYRLPTEAEWEYAARAGTKTKYFWGDKIDKDYIWFKENSGNHTQVVGLKQPNPFGLYDMVGNIWEWCEDWYDFDYYRNSPVEDPQGPESGVYKVIRGGAWNSGIRNIRISDRSSRSPDLGSLAIGFRPVKKVE